MTFYWLTPFVDSFVNSDWLDLVIYFHTNELVNKTFSWSTFQTTAIYDEVFKASLRDFWDRHFKKNSRKPQKCFSKVTMPPFRYQLAMENL